MGPRAVEPGRAREPLRPQDEALLAGARAGDASCLAVLLGLATGHWPGGEAVSWNRLIQFGRDWPELKGHLPLYQGELAWAAEALAELLDATDLPAGELLRLLSDSERPLKSSVALLRNAVSGLTAEELAAGLVDPWPELQVRAWRWLRVRGELDAGYRKLLEHPGSELWTLARLEQARDPLLRLQVELLHGDLERAAEASSDELGAAYRSAPRASQVAILARLRVEGGAVLLARIFRRLRWTPRAWKAYADSLPAEEARARLGELPVAAAARVLQRLPAAPEEASLRALCPPRWALRAPFARPLGRVRTDLLLFTRSGEVGSGEDEILFQLAPKPPVDMLPYLSCRRVRRSLPGGQPFFAQAVAGDGRDLAAGCSQEGIFLWSLSSRRVLRVERRVPWAGFGPVLFCRLDGRTLYVLCERLEVLADLDRLPADPPEPCPWSLDLVRWPSEDLFVAPGGRTVGVQVVAPDEYILYRLPRCWGELAGFPRWEAHPRDLPPSPLQRFAAELERYHHRHAISLTEMVDEHAIELEP